MVSRGGALRQPALASVSMERFRYPPAGSLIPQGHHMLIPADDLGTVREKILQLVHPLVAPFDLWRELQGGRSLRRAGVSG